MTVMLLGDPGVGKSTFVYAYSSGFFLLEYKPTVILDTFSVTISIEVSSIDHDINFAQPRSDDDE